MEHGWGVNSREHMLENGDLKVPLNLQNRFLTVQSRIKPVEMKMKAAWRCNPKQVGPCECSSAGVSSAYSRCTWPDVFTPLLPLLVSLLVCF